MTLTIHWWGKYIQAHPQTSLSEIFSAHKLLNSPLTNLHRFTMTSSAAVHCCMHALLIRKILPLPCGPSQELSCFSLSSPNCFV